MPTLHVYGLDHSRLTLAAREQLALGPDEMQKLLPALVGSGRTESLSPVAEGMLLSTCHRTELYLMQAVDAWNDSLLRLCGLAGIPQSLLTSAASYHFSDRHAVRYLYAVAASLHSPVKGDTQIAQQIHGAMEVARKAGTLGPMLQQLVEGALHAAKRVRRETGLMAGDRGIGPAVLQTLRRSHARTLAAESPLRVLLLGTGRMAAEVAAHLCRTGPDRRIALTVRDVQIAGVWGRDAWKASRFAADHGLRAVPDQSVPQLLRTVDAVVGACRGRVGVLSADLLEPVLAARTTPLTVIDLGVPRNLDPSLGDRDGLFPIGLDDVHQFMRERGRQRTASLDRAHRIVDEEAARMDRLYQAWPLRPMRAELYTTLEAILCRWRPDQPDAVRHLRSSIHRSLHEAFGSVLPSGIRPLRDSATNS